MRQPFYREQRRWAFPHAVVPLAVYNTTRSVELSILLAYVWESVEFLISMRVKYFREARDDSLIGDPLNAALSVLTMRVFDKVFGWDELIVAEVSLLRRVLCLVALALPVSLIEIGGDERWHVIHLGVVAYTVYYNVIVLAFYTPIFSDVSAGVINSVMVWLICVNLYALAVAPLARSEEFPPYLRIISLSVLFLLFGAFAALAVK